MDPILAQRLAYIFQCVDESELAHYFSPVLYASDPVPFMRGMGGPEVRQAFSCYRQNHDPRRCLREIAHTDVNVAAFPLSARVRDIGRHLLALDTRIQNAGGFSLDLNRELSAFEFERQYTLQSFSSPELAFIRGLENFLRSSQPRFEDFLSALRAHPVHGAIYRLYERPLESLPLQPSLCSNMEDWRQLNLQIRGFRYSVPVFLSRAIDPRDISRIEDGLREGFEILKFFIPPTAMDEILHPSNGRPDFSLIMGNEDSELARLHRCGIFTDHRAGQLDINDNQVMLIGFNEQLFEWDWRRRSADRERLANRNLVNFLHEFAHALDFVLMDDNAEVQSGLEALRDYLEHSYPLFLNSDRQRYRFGPILPRVSRPEPQRSNYPHSLNNRHELFADWFAEYVINALESEDLSIPREAGPHEMIRQRILARFFRPEGFDFSVLHASSLREAYRSYGVELPLNERNSITSFRPEVSSLITSQGNFGAEASLNFVRESILYNRFYWGVGLHASMIGLQNFSSGPQFSLGYPSGYPYLFQPELNVSGGLSYSASSNLAPYLETGLTVYSPRKWNSLRARIGISFFMPFDGADSQLRFSAGLAYW